MKVPSLSLSNPVIIYTAIWLILLFLVSLRITTNLPAINNTTLFLVLSNICSFWLLYFCLWSTYPPRPAKLSRNINPEISARLNRFTRRLLLFWALGTIFEVIQGGGVPIVWAFSQGIDKDYTSFGIPTFHGFMNALYLFSVTALFLDYLVRKRHQDLWLVLSLLCWPVIILGRGILLGVLCQLSGVYLVLNKISWRKTIQLLMIVVLLICAFGAIGDIRGTPNPFGYLLDDRYQDIFEQLPSGFLWFYVYITSPLSNIIANIDIVEPTYIPYYSITGLLPTVIRDWIAPHIGQHDVFRLVDQNLNVSTFYAGYLSDFGVLGSIAIVALLQLVVVVVYFYAKRGKVWAILAYAVLFQCVVFSIFYNLFFLQVYIMQVAIALYFKSYVERMESRLQEKDMALRKWPPAKPETSN